MNRKILIISLSWIAVIATIIMILNFSAENAKESSATSEGIIKDILEVVMPEEEITPQIIRKFQIPIRKIAHFGIYMLLGFCLANAYKNTLPLKRLIVYLISFVSLFLFSILDEMVIQASSDGRGPSFVDSLIDSSGGIVGILFFLFISFVSNKIIKKNPS